MPLASASTPTMPLAPRLPQRRRPPAALALAAAFATVCAAAPVAAQTAPTPGTASEAVLVPEVDRRDVRVPKIPSRDFYVGLLGGTYATENFGSSFVGGLRLGYAITEDFFVEGVYAQAKVSDDAFRQVLPGGVLASDSEKLTYYNVSLGYNILPGEGFVGRKRAYPTALYVIAGIGSTELANQSRQTVNFGVGLRVHLSERMALQVDMRDHLFSLDLLGKRQSTQNLELTAGIGFYF